MKNIAHLCDCMDFMKGLPNNAYDLAIVDPPYFEGAGDPKYYRPRKTESNHKPIKEGWNIPGAEYFNSLSRISKRAIVWGVNYYAQFFPYAGRIIWDKKNDGSPFSQAEIAGYTEGVKVWVFRFLWNGMLQDNMKNKETRIHPTQKPVALYKWLLTNYANPGDTIFDSHVGSGSIRIACHDLGFDFEGCEIDPDYHKAQEERFRIHQLQLSLF